MIKKINFTAVVISVTFLGLGLGILTGTIQEHIHFAGFKNELAFSAVSFFGAIAFAAGIKK
jgi:hypothetical protein